MNRPVRARLCWLCLIAAGAVAAGPAEAQESPGSVPEEDEEETTPDGNAEAEPEPGEDAEPAVAGDAAEVCRLGGEARLLCERCFAGDGEACGDLAFSFLYGDEGLPMDRERARVLFARGCELNDAGSCAHLGSMAEGDEGWAYTLRACRLGSAAACSDVARGSTDAGEVEAALATLRRHCDAGADFACGSLGRYYDDDEGPAPSRDLERAVSYYDRACELGSVSSCRRGTPAHPEPIERFLIVVSSGMSFDLTGSDPATPGFTFEIGLAYRHRLYRPLREPWAFQIVPELGYTFDYHAPELMHWGALGLGFRFASDESEDLFGLTLTPSFIFSFLEEPAVGVRTSLRIGLYYDTAFIAVAHEWQRIGDTDRHLIRLTFCMNFGALSMALFHRYL